MIIELICIRYSLPVGKRLIYVLFVFSTAVHAQIGGKKSFEFVNVPNNARLAALGGENVSLADRDVNFFYANPALVGDTLAGMASFSYQAYVAGINQTTVSYAHKFKRIGLLAAGVQHLGYGTIKSYDATGADLGDYQSGETAVVISKSHQVNNFRLGVSLKALFSALAGYRSSAMALDVGAAFIHPKRNFTAGLVLKNIGVVLSEYSETSNTKLPIDVEVGVTAKPEHMPLRFSLTGYNFVRQNLVYYNPADGTDKPGSFDKVLRHFNFATEILLHRNVNVMVAYNYLVHQELKLENGGGGAGISLGLSAKVKSVEFVFSRSGYVAGKAGYTFTLAIDTNRILKRR